MNILIVYGTLEGQTEKIAEYMAGMIRNRGHHASIHMGWHLPTTYSTDGFDAAIIGGSVHMKSYPACINKFILTHGSWLNSVPSAFFTVCLGVISKHEEHRNEAYQYESTFLGQVGWQPIISGTFAGALKYSKYPLTTRLIMKMISRREGRSTDTTHDHEYTNWDDVERFTDRFLTEAMKTVNIEIAS
ncbi:flavodoxin domain-containing protein [Kaarinaea lacus]